MKTRSLGWLGWVALGVMLVACSDGSSSEASDATAAPQGDSKNSNPGGTSTGGSSGGGISATGGSAGKGTGSVGAGGGSNGAAGKSGIPQGSAGAAGGGFIPGSGGKGGGPSGSAGSGGAAEAGGSAGAAGDGAAGEAGAAGAAGEAGAAGAAGADACAGVDLETPTTLYLSSDDSNSMASAALARSMINNGQAPPPYMIRAYEFLNYYNVPYEPANPGSLRVVPQMRPGAKPGEYDVQIGVQSAPALAPRRPMNITLVLDTSGSMQGQPMALQNAAIKAIASQLRSGDVISMSTWNTDTNVVLSGHVVQGPSDPQLLAAADSLFAGGGTDLHAGLVNGYDLARKHYAEERINRVVVISDGVANVGVTDEQMIGKEADIENKEGIYLVGVGVGDGVNDTLLNVVTDAGNGAYLYLDTPEEAQKMLSNRFDEVMEIAARNVQVSMTMPSYFSIVKFSGEQYSTDPAKVKPQHLAPGDAMVISQTVRACSPSLVLDTDPMLFKATWIEPGTWAPRSVELSTSVGELQAQADAQLRRGKAIVAYADALRKGQSCSARKALVADALAAADAADPQHNDGDLVEIRNLTTKFGQLCP